MSNREQSEVSRLVMCAEMAMNVPANDNVGIAWRLTDAEPHEDDFRYEAIAATRIAKAIVPAVETALRGTWMVSKHYDRAQVRFRTATVASNASRRREKFLQNVLPLAGFASW